MSRADFCQVRNWLRCFFVWCCWVPTKCGILLQCTTKYVELRTALVVRCSTTKSIELSTDFVVRCSSYSILQNVPGNDDQTPELVWVSIIIREKNQKVSVS